MLIGTGRRRGWTAMLAVAATMALVVGGCGGDDDEGGSASSGGGESGAAEGGGTVKVGNISSIAGLGGVFAGFQAGVKGFFEYYNANGGIDGTQVELITVDDAADPARRPPAPASSCRRTRSSPSSAWPASPTRPSRST